jgi:Riboflavin synthase alpha chain
LLKQFAEIMFTGIVETTGTVVAVSQSGSNRTFTIASSLSETLKTDQSVSHNGVCLTVETVADGQHTVTAIAETLSKTNLGHWQAGTAVNIERCVPMNGRLDGHLVQGHVDSTASCLFVENQDGSWLYTFEYPKLFAHLIIEKGAFASMALASRYLTLLIIAFLWQSFPTHLSIPICNFCKPGKK